MTVEMCFETRSVPRYVEGFEVAAKGCHLTWKREMPRQTADFPTVSQAQAAAGRLEIKQVFRPSDDGYKEGGSSAIFFSVAHDACMVSPWTSIVVVIPPLMRGPVRKDIEMLTQ